MNIFEKLLLVFVSFSFVFKITLSTPAIVLLLLMNISLERKSKNTIFKLLSSCFFLLVAMFALSFYLVPEERLGTLVKELGMLFIPVMFYVKKFKKDEVLYFVGSFLIFQLIHILYVDFVMIKGIYFDNLEKYQDFISLVERKFIVERPYFALNSLLAIVCSKFLFDKKRIGFLVSALISVFITISLVLSAARLASGVSVLLLIVILLQKERLKYFAMFIAIMVISVLSFGRHMVDRVLFKDGEPRIVIWDCAHQIIKSKDFNYLIGEFSSEKVDNKLVNCYNSEPVKSGPYWWIGELKYNYNTHNQFLWFLTSYGLIGLFLFLSIFIIQGYNFFRDKNIYALLFVVVFFSQSVFESILCRQLGIYLFVWFSFIWLTEKKGVING